MRTTPFESTARGREIGYFLRQLRETTTDLSTIKMADKLAWPKSKLSRVELGKFRTSDVDVATYLASFGQVVREDFKRMLQLAREPETDYWVRPHRPDMPQELRSLIVAETTASSIASYHPLTVPGLLQTEQYMRELFKWSTKFSPEEIELRVQARLARQKLLRGLHGPECTFFIHERALNMVVGSPGLMNEQLLHLVFADSLPRCSIRVVLDEAGPMGALGPMFGYMRYAEHPPAVYTETHVATLFLEKREDLASYREVLAVLARYALKEAQSRGWIAHRASTFDRVEASTLCPPANGPD
ncbi:DUF5753 domain-containing protein [Amycolatopsis anabasis]|uniref:DUF5753 domain-containing protein n=1 Tax=Amycolatopsis anabasis TaxID=1840409 RepID=UPI00131E233C|nr:DUF5753 domain-containing protein [Amycolatopsis anabasis]